MSELFIPDIVLNIAMASLVAVSAGLASIVSAARGARRRLQHRRTRITDALRPTVVLLAGGEPDEVRQAQAALIRLDARRWRALLPSIASLLTKLRGESHRALVELLLERGTLGLQLRRLDARSPIRRASAAELLGASAVPAAVDSLLPRLRDRDSEVRQVAARALGRIADPAGIRPLFASLGSDRPIPPRIVAASVARCAATAPSEVDEVLATGTPAQQAIAAEVCGMIGARSALPTLTALLLSDTDLEVRIRAARAVGRLGVSGVAPQLVLVCAVGQPQPLRAVAAKALGDIGSPWAVPSLSDLATDPDDRVAVNASAALARCGAAGVAALSALAAVGGNVQAQEALTMARLRRQVPNNLLPNNTGRLPHPRTGSSVAATSGGVP